LTSLKGGSRVVHEIARRAKLAQPSLGAANSEVRNEALERIAASLEANQALILKANSADVAAASSLPLPMIARLRLDRQKLVNMIAGVRAVAALQDVVGQELAVWERPNGLQIQRVRVPIGVIGIIYEARPGVTVDASAICLKSGNAVLLKGGKEAARSNQALGEAIAAGLAQAGLSTDLVSVLPATREASTALMTAVGLVDVLIPRGGAGLIQAVLAESRVPVIETGAGVCHIYVHEQANLAMARAITVNAKCSSPAVCNAAETLLVDQAVAREFLPSIGADLQAAGVRLKGCDETQAILHGVEAALPDDYATEYNDLVMNVRIVANLDEAMAHIAHYGTKHSDVIVTADEIAAARFEREVDSAAVYHNASSRFTDGGEFGFGAEIGISTSKLHARGPMGLAEMTSIKYIVRGNGQIR
jgi:glutamate-5-semialdehyde dehydrogenase